MNALRTLLMFSPLLPIQKLVNVGVSIDEDPTSPMLPLLLPLLSPLPIACIAHVFLLDVVDDDDDNDDGKDDNDGEAYTNTTQLIRLSRLVVRA